MSGTNPIATPEQMARLNAERRRMMFLGGHMHMVVRTVRCPHEHPVLKSLDPDKDVMDDAAIETYVLTTIGATTLTETWEAYVLDGYRPTALEAQAARL